MNITRTQKPYVFRPPKYSPVLAPLLRKISELLFLRRLFRMRNVTWGGAGKIRELIRHGHAVLIAPNHADHADPHVLLYIGKKNGFSLRFMAAREGFEKRRLNAFVLQHLGAFSVDRDGADLSAFKAAIRILQDEEAPLVVFPEGQIYHHHERLDPLNEGVAAMLLRATRKSPEDRGFYLVPSAMRYTYDESVTETFCERLSVLEEQITWKPRNDMDPVDRIYRLGSGLLALKEVEFLGHGTSGGLIERIKNLQDHLVAMVEEKHLSRPGAGSTPERVKVLRGKLRLKLTEPDPEISLEEKNALYDDLDTLFVAFQLYSYPGEYLKEDPSTDRIAETIFKLEEDVLGQENYPVPRDVHVEFGVPIEVKSFLTEHSLDVKSGVGPLTTRMSEMIRSMLDTGS